MSRYIDKDMELSFPLANGEYDLKNANEHFIFGCETYKEWLEELPTADVVERKTVQWIPVTERLPEDDVAVLVTDDERKVRFDACGTELFTERRFWFNSKNVLAWMPLPEPYREVE